VFFLQSCSTFHAKIIKWSGCCGLVRPQSVSVGGAPVRGWVETKWPLRKTTTTEMMIVGGTSRREIISSRGQSEKESRPQTLPLCLCVPRLPRGVCHAFGCYFCLLCSVCITFAVQWASVGTSCNLYLVIQTLLQQIAQCTAYCNITYC